MEVSAREQDQSLVQEMVVLEQSADVLCADLESVLQATTRQAADHQTLLDVKTQLENEIQDYRKLLDGLEQLGYVMDKLSNVETSPISHGGGFVAFGQNNNFHCVLAVVLGFFC